ncbi:MFS transporter [Geodermatophilus sabuli]|uniref:MFS transporter n=1 Tax=Geodermatophilus sabuli TaxID=1564158 RepID=A0A7K3W5Z6_9ACTN|nr:MFS transporter [Geodermatophilus sabuli]
MSSAADAPPAPTGSRELALIGAAIVLTALNLRTAVTSVGPVLEELQDGLGLSSGLVGVVTTLPVLCFAGIGFAGPLLTARFRDAHVLGAALGAMAAGLVLRAVTDSFGGFVAGTVVAMTGGALGNVLLPGLVKRYFPTRTGLLVGAYSTAMTVGGAAAAVVTQPIADAAGPGGWRWALGIWSALALVAALSWLAVRARPGARGRAVRAVRMRSLARSRLAVCFSLFFGSLTTLAYIVMGWSAQYLRDAGLSPATAGLMLGINSLAVIPLNATIPSLVVRPGLQRPLLLVLMAGYTTGFAGLMAAPLVVPWLWMVLIAVGMGTFPMVLTLLGLRARTPETTAALATVAQGVGYLLAAAGPLLVGLLRGSAGGYTGMFVVVAVALVGALASGWVVTRQTYVDDEVPGWSPASTGGRVVARGNDPLVPGAEHGGTIVG